MRLNLLHITFDVYFTDLEFSLMTGHVVGSWRIFMLICTIPIYLSIIGLIFMPESPRYLLQVRHGFRYWRLCIESIKSRYLVALDISGIILCIITLRLCCNTPE